MTSDFIRLILANPTSVMSREDGTIKLRTWSKMKVKERLKFEETVQDSFKITALLSFFRIFRLKERIDGQKSVKGSFVSRVYWKNFFLKSKTI